MPALPELYEKVEEDEQRGEVGFSDEMREANEWLIDEGTPVSRRTEVLSVWLQKQQPCLFGRFAAKNDRLTYCMLTETDLVAGDDHVRRKIQQARLEWTAAGFVGLKSGFVVLAASKRLALARPDSALSALARRLCELYLLRDIVENTIYLDEMFLVIPGNAEATFRWDAGVNFFGAQGDRRWWHDHRIPGGIAFSVNSVGHMVKAGVMNNSLEHLYQEVGVDGEELPGGPIDSLGKALILAMQTIARAAKTVSGPATSLVPLPSPSEAEGLPECPVDLPPSLAGMNYCEYSGKYHTDETLPAEYFRQDVERPRGLATHHLDLRYLFHDSVGNPDFLNMGVGRRVRAIGEEDAEEEPGRTRGISRVTGSVVRIKDYPLLIEALRADEEIEDL